MRTAWFPMLMLLLTASPARAGDRVQRESFEAAWRRVGEAWPYADMNGLDWDEVRALLLPRARRARTNADLRLVLEDMLDRLDASHLGVTGAATTGAEASLRALATRGLRPDLGPPGDFGFTARLLAGAWYAATVTPGSPADAAGVRPGDRLHAVAGTDLDAVTALLDDAPDEALLAGYAVAAALRRPAGEPAELELTDATGRRRALVTAAPVDAAWSELAGQPVLVEVSDTRLDEGRVSWLRLSTFTPDVVARVTALVERLVADGVDGVVLDLRGNNGGLGLAATGVAGHFLAPPGGSLGRTVTRSGAMELVVRPRIARQRFDGPLAVLVDPRTASTAELCAGGLQAAGRARVFGEPTAGLALLSLMERLPNGDTLQFVIGDLALPDGTRLEGRGVLPDVLAPLVPGAGVDPPLEAALAWIRVHRAPEPSP